MTNFNNKKIVERSCVICRQQFNKSDLVRIVKLNDDEVKIDDSGKLNGRGSYICKSKDCVQKLEKGNALEHSLRMHNLNSDAKAELLRELNLKLGGM